VIDPELTDELRVTVVATGLNRPQHQVQGARGGRDVGYVRGRHTPDPRDEGRDFSDPPRGRRVDYAPPREREPVAARGGADMRVVRRPVPAQQDYAGYEKPPVQRMARAVGDGMSAHVDEEVLDIPAFLRRQAD
jgi:hypothetical protein